MPVTAVSAILISLHLSVYQWCHKEYGERVVKGLKPDIEHVRKLAGMTQEQRVADC